MKYFLIVCSSLLLGACAFHSGQFVTDLPNDPVEHIDVAVGVAQTTRLFGLGGTGKDALLREARQAMIANRPLVDDEAYNNYTIDVKRTYFLIGSKTKVTMSADVIAPKDTVSNPSYSTEYLSKVDQSISHYDTLFHMGDSVIYDHNEMGEIVGFEGHDNKDVRIQYRTSGGELRTTVRKGTHVFVLASFYRGNRPRISRDLGNLVAYGVKGDMFKGDNGTYFYYNHNE